MILKGRLESYDGDSESHCGHLGRPASITIPPVKLEEMKVHDTALCKIFIEDREHLEYIKRTKNFIVAIVPEEVKEKIKSYSPVIPEGKECPHWGGLKLIIHSSMQQNVKFFGESEIARAEKYNNLVDELKRLSGVVDKLKKGGNENVWEQKA